MDENVLSKELELRGLKENPYLEIGKGIVKVLSEVSEEKGARLLDMVRMFDGNVVKRQGMKYRLKGSFKRRLSN